MNLIIDIGNTKTKWAVFDNSTIIKKGNSEEFSLIHVQDLVNSFSIDKSIISTVSKIPDGVEELLRQNTKFVPLTRNSKLPFTLNYKTPETLGLDRIALCAGAQNEFPSENTLIIDAGTCITYDFKNSNGEYFGGAISPGIEMRFKSLPEFTHALPYIEDRNYVNLIGNSTKSSIISGIMNGVYQEIDGVINQYKARFEKLNIILTGGDIIFFEDRLKNDFFARPEFLLFGLNVIAEINA